MYICIYVYRCRFPCAPVYAHQSGRPRVIPESPESLPRAVLGALPGRWGGFWKRVFNPRVRFLRVDWNFPSKVSSKNPMSNRAITPALSIAGVEQAQRRQSKSDRTMTHAVS